MSILCLIRNHEENLNEMLVNDTEYRKYLNKAGDSWNKLKAIGMTQEQKDLIENIESASGCIGSIYSEISYEKGFRDAVRLIIESLVSP